MKVKRIQTDFCNFDVEIETTSVGTFERWRPIDTETFEVLPPVVVFDANDDRLDAEKIEIAIEQTYDMMQLYHRQIKLVGVNFEDDDRVHGTFVCSVLVNGTMTRFRATCKRDYCPVVNTLAVAVIQSSREER